MTKINIKEEYIKNNYTKLNTIKHYESDIYIHKKLVYKVLKENIRKHKFKIIPYIYNINFKYAVNIQDLLYDNNNFIGTTSIYISKFETLKQCMKRYDLYEKKEIINCFIDFFNNVTNKKLLYYDIHLNNIGLSNNNLYVMDIDSVEFNDNQINIKYALNSILTLFYELCLNCELRNEYNNYHKIIANISKSSNYLLYNLNINELIKIINNTTEESIFEAKKILKLN